MTNNLPAVPSDNEFQILQVVARTAAASGLYSGVGSEQKIFMILLAAREMGIQPMQALNGGLWNIQGKIELSARLMTTMIRQAKHSINIKTISDKECTLEGKRADNGDIQTASFTIEEAQRAGLVRQGGNWVKYPQDMLYARALSRLGRRLFADVIGNAYVEGEIREAKCEIIESVVEEPENQDLSEQKILEYISQYSNEDHELMKAYFQKYASHWKKSISQSLQDYENREKFERDFNKWKNKVIESKVSVVTSTQ